MKNIKIVDPAVGSGAFPMGMMNEIVKTRSILSFLLKNVKNNYDLKRETIENCLYGVDIDSSAVDIAKLRFWLSLIVDESDMAKIKPLPNLDYKILCGNSLLEEFEGVKLFDEKFLEEIPKDDSSIVEQIKRKMDELHQELGEIYIGKKKDNGRKIEIEKELKKLERKKREISSMVKEETQQYTIDQAFQYRIKESHKKLVELRKLQKDFFNAEGKKNKKYLADKIDKIEWELIEETLKEQDNEVAMLKLQQYKKNKSKPFFLWKLYFSEVFQRDNPGFDVVIANPPYGIVYDENLKEMYENRFLSFHRNNDIYIAFYENGISLLRENGIIVYITPNTFLNGDYFNVWREILTGKTMIREVLDFKNIPIFADPTVFVSVMLCINKFQINYPYNFNLKIAEETIDKFHTNSVEIKNSSDKKIKAENPIFRKISQENNIDVMDNLFFVKDVGFNYWTKGKGKTRDGNSIGDRVFYNGNRENNKDVPFLKGRDVFKYFHNQPNNYLKHNYKIYLDKEIDTFRFSEEFLKQSPKIVYRQTANSIIATIDYFSNYLDKTVHLIVPKNNSNSLDLKYILALLNSNLFNFLYGYISQEVEGRAFAQVKTTYIKQLIIKKISAGEQQPFIKLVDKIFNITNSPDYLDSPEKQARVKTLEKEIDNLVYKLYDLNPEEISIVENFNKAK